MKKSHEPRDAHGQTKKATGFNATRGFKRISESLIPPHRPGPRGYTYEDYKDLFHEDPGHGDVFEAGSG